MTKQEFDNLYSNYTNCITSWKKCLEIFKKNNFHLIGLSEQGYLMNFEHWKEVSWLYNRVSFDDSEQDIKERNNIITFLVDIFNKETVRINKIVALFNREIIENNLL